ncbi:MULTISPECIES: ribosome maturation factor RimM [unclassified Actinomyces]|uniref:ribosome maturation factor RimM n=1 Tax=unclassified Actinomyces TaxID=2609248 RepID=UPI002017AB88|nr:MULTISPECIES: ribosome maturation factor RimM [unclassified Actinomyces]MCL3778629.1 ribosome maturation factor RimM [Actinomyces sp. AC-20-1]MCL3790912.1 ribosome maturation factor RimM [Actinomyces sp. 187325]MCL3793176.1 ribosome maturation factor RimM [Actinomyces sp. 186855]MCL3795567.1 ribosome maturation factor RimM [Actinomyces sp. 217892]
MLLTVAVIGPAHALKGEVRLDIRTDDPEGRLEPGTVLPTDPDTAGPLTVTRLRFDGQRWYAAFAEARDRTAAESLRGVHLLVDTEDEQDGTDEDAWYAHELIGLTAVRLGAAATGPRVLGVVTDLEPGVAQDRLVVRTPQGEQVAVPFVEALVPGVDLEAGTVTLDPPGGLFPGLGEAEDAR